MNGDYNEYNDYKYRSKNEYSWEPSHKSSISVGAMLKLFVKMCSLNLQNHTHSSKSVHLISQIINSFDKKCSFNSFVKKCYFICKIIFICQKVFT